jgi:hypothetical protein
MQLKWTDHWRVLFGYEPDQQEVDSLLAWLDYEFPKHGTDSGWQPDELIKALEAFAEKSREKGERSKAPTGPQIKTLIIRARYESRRQSEPEPDQEECGLCKGGGWIAFYESCGEIMTIKDSENHHCSDIPCLCSRGEHWMRTCTDYKTLTDHQRELFHGKRRLAAKQTASLNRAFMSTEQSNIGGT